MAITVLTDVLVRGSVSAAKQNTPPRKRWNFQPKILSPLPQVWLMLTFYGITNPDCDTPSPTNFVNSRAEFGTITAIEAVSIHAQGTVNITASEPGLREANYIWLEMINTQGKLLFLLQFYSISLFLSLEPRFCFWIHWRNLGAFRGVSFSRLSMKTLGAFREFRFPGYHACNQSCTLQHTLLFLCLTLNYHHDNTYFYFIVKH